MYNSHINILNDLSRQTRRLKYIPHNVYNTTQTCNPLDRILIIKKQPKIYNCVDTKSKSECKDTKSKCQDTKSVAKKCYKKSFNKKCSRSSRRKCRSRSSSRKYHSRKSSYHSKHHSRKSSRHSRKSSRHSRHRTRSSSRHSKSSSNRHLNVVNQNNNQVKENDKVPSEPENETCIIIKTNYIFVTDKELNITDGQISGDNNIPTNFIYINSLTDDNVDVSDFLDLIATNPYDRKGLITISPTDTPTNYKSYIITDVEYNDPNYILSVVNPQGPLTSLLNDGSINIILSVLNPEQINSDDPGTAGFWGQWTNMVE